jgi:hypothetical protein
VDILDRVSRLPITSWHFKTDPRKRHVGPMAQDFHAAFGLDGDDDKHINFKPRMPNSNAISPTCKPHSRICRLKAQALPSGDGVL